MAQEISHIVTVPTDTQSGQPSGQRVHKPFVFTCSLNKAVPLLYNALTIGITYNYTYNILALQVLQCFIKTKIFRKFPYSKINLKVFLMLF